MQLVLCCVIGVCCCTLGYGQSVIDSTGSGHERTLNSVNVDIVYLLLGAVSPGAEFSITDEMSLIGAVTMGDMLFTKIDGMYEVGLRYNFPLRKIRGMNVSSTYYSMQIEYRDRKAKASGLVLTGGYKWLLTRFIVMDVSAGMNITASPRVSFEQTSGNFTKSVSIGGPGFTVNARIGIGW
jgi:hypothetical protein